MAENVGEYITSGMISGTSHWERAGAAITKMAEAIGEFAAAMDDACASVFSGVAKMLACQNAYARAEKVNPKWVHFAKYHKKKRIRKKYHNRIMREFGGDR